MNIFIRKILVGLVLLIILSPLGIILPKVFHAGDSWGEGSTDKVKKELGYVPVGMEKNAEIWKAPLPDYSNGKGRDSLFSGSVYYILSGFVGVSLISAATWSLFKLYRKNE